MLFQVRAGASSQAGDLKQVDAALKAAERGLADVEARRDALLATKSDLADERNSGREQCAPRHTPLATSYTPPSVHGLCMSRHLLVE